MVQSIVAPVLSRVRVMIIPVSILCVDVLAHGQHFLARALNTRPVYPCRTAARTGGLDEDHDLKK